MKGSIAELRAAVERELALEAMTGPVHHFRFAASVGRPVTLISSESGAHDYRGIGLLPAAATRLVVAHLGPWARTHLIVLDLMPAIVRVVKDEQELDGAYVYFVRGSYQGWRTLSCRDFVEAVLEGAIRDAGGEP